MRAEEQLSLKKILMSKIDQVESLGYVTTKQTVFIYLFIYRFEQSQYYFCDNTVNQHFRVLDLANILIFNTRRHFGSMDV